MLYTVQRLNLQCTTQCTISALPSALILIHSQLRTALCTDLNYWCTDRCGSVLKHCGMHCTV